MAGSSRAAIALGVAVALLVASGGGPARTADRPVSSGKADPRVLEDTAGGRTGHFLVVLREQASARVAAARAHDRRMQGRLVVDALRQAAEASQWGVRAELQALGARFRSYWIVDAFAVEGGRAVVEAMAARADVKAIEPDRASRGLLEEGGQRAPATATAVEWNIDKVSAPAVWRLGYTGQNVVYANADAGVRWDHPALKPRYRGWSGTSASHDYNWWDAVHSDIDGNGTNPCGFSSATPCDDDDRPNGSHGTHTMGIAVGDDGAGNQIGMAPGAKWIACRNMDQGVGRPSTYIECLQFFLAPTDLRGGNPDPDKRPNVVGNSYDCPPAETCSVGSLQAAVDTMRAAGVFMAVSAGNQGPGCSSMATPPAIYDSAVTVAATDGGDAVLPFSSRGPVTADGSSRRKPDLAAPGVNVRSSIGRDAYGVKQGTSMAAPHVGGAVLLLWSAFPSLRGNVDRTEQILEQSALRLTTAQGCGGDSSTQVPNNSYGYGRIDVLAAYEAAQAESPPSLSVTNASVVEGQSGTTSASFAVSLSRASTKTVTASYATAPATATAGSDYTTTSGTLTFAPGETAKTVSVPVVGDTVFEPDETFLLELSGPTNATLGRGHGSATIVNDDADTTPPVLSALKLSPRAFRASTGTLVRFVLSERATTTFTIERPRPGARPVRVAGFSFEGAKGANSLRLAGRLAGRELPRGDYRLTAVPRDQAGNTGKPVGSAFRIIG